jgi:signal transduction histidine kinase
MGHYGVQFGANGAPDVKRSLNNRRRPGVGRSGARATMQGLVLIGLGVGSLAAPIALRSATVTAPTLRAAIEMMTTLFALAAAWLLRAHFSSSRRLRDLLLLASILVLGTINFAAAALPAALNVHAGMYFAAARLGGLPFVGAIFAAAAFVPSDWLITSRRHPLTITTGLVVAGLACAGLIGLIAPPRGQEESLPAALGHPLLLVLVVAATVALAYAAAGFARRKRVENDRLGELVAAALMMMAGAAFANVLSGAVAPGRVGANAILRLLASGLLLGAALVAERRAHARISKATALVERQRLARDLHDGIAQDLAFIAAHGSRFAQELGDDHPVVVAARRALAVSRGAISELSDPLGATTHEALEAVAHDLRERFGIAIAVNTELARDLKPHERENVTRIAREAIVNAARHGAARSVIVSLRQSQNGIALRIVDDGCGIAGVDRVPAAEGFGLRSMRERAAALGGQLNLRQPRRGGTELEVVLP